MPTLIEFVDLSGQATRVELTDPQLKPRSVDAQPAITITSDRLLSSSVNQVFIHLSDRLGEQVFKSLLRFRL
jgi:hypothetical protein